MDCFRKLREIRSQTHYMQSLENRPNANLRYWRKNKFSSDFYVSTLIRNPMENFTKNVLQVFSNYNLRTFWHRMP